MRLQQVSHLNIRDSHFEILLHWALYIIIRSYYKKEINRIDDNSMRTNGGAYAGFALPSQPPARLGDMEVDYNSW